MAEPASAGLGICPMPHAVYPFDLMLFWPLELRLEDVGRAELRQALGKRLLEGSDWKEVDDPLRRDLGRAEDGYAYAEWCDVHPFVRRFLYGDGSERATFDLYQLKSAAIRAIEIDEPKCKIVFEIRDCRLYVADGGLAFAILDLSAKEATDWEQALAAISNFRGIYPKYFANYSEKWDDASEWKPGDVYERVRLLPLEAGRSVDEILTEYSKWQPGGQRLDRALDKSNRRPPILRHWERLLRPLFEIGVSPHVLSDHRLSLMTWMAVEDIKAISPDDWMALCEADVPGFATYSPEFRDAELEAAGYDRWWKEAPADGSEDRYAGHAHRYLVCDKVYANVTGRPSGDVPEWFFRMTDRMRRSWRRQYFNIWFLVQFQKVALTILRDQLVAIAERFSNQAMDGGEKSTVRLLEEVGHLRFAQVLFSSRYWFGEVSPQVQPQQLYEKLKAQQGVDGLNQTVSGDLASFATWAYGQEEHRREAFRARIERWVIPFGLFLAFLGANVIVEPAQRLITDFLGYLCAGPNGIRWFCVVVPQNWFDIFVDFVTTAILGGSAWYGYRWFREWREGKRKG